jgi:hypothetical protein
MVRFRKADLRRLEVRESPYSIDIIGLASDSVGDVTIDQHTVLIQHHPYSTIFLQSKRKAEVLTFEMAWFYADCLSYDHECPSIVYASPGEQIDPKYRYVHPAISKPEECSVIVVDDNPNSHRSEKLVGRPTDSQRLVRQTFMDYLSTSYQMARESRHGFLTYVRFRQSEDLNTMDLAYSKWLAHIRTPIGYYSAALKQTDFLGEFLNYYRVVEYFAKGNGKSWVAMNLPRIREHDFGTIQLFHDMAQNGNPKNIFAVYRRRALLRLTHLLSKCGSYDAVATHMYNTNRCGIAHGKFDGLLNQTTKTYFDIGKDAVIMKLLARMAIDQNHTRT